MTYLHINRSHRVTSYNTRSHLVTHENKSVTKVALLEYHYSYTSRNNNSRNMYWSAVPLHTMRHIHAPKQIFLLYNTTLYILYSNSQKST